MFVGDVGDAVGPEIDAQVRNLWEIESNMTNKWDQVMEFVRQFDAIEDKAVE